MTDYVSVMATTTPEAPASITQDGHPPAPLHLCYDALDDDRLYDDVIDPEPASELHALPNLRGHAECPMPDGFELPSTDCWVFRAKWSSAVNARGTAPTVETITVGSTTSTDAMLDGMHHGATLQERGQRGVTISQPRRRGMGHEVRVSFILHRPLITGSWWREATSCAPVSPLPPLPAPPRVPTEARAVRLTDRPASSWMRVIDPAATHREVRRRLDALRRSDRASDRGAA